MKGYVAIVLHAHLPWVRHPEHARPLEERWLHEALWESYLPLCEMLDRLAADGVPARLTVSVSPTLAAMLADPLLKSRFVLHLDSLDALVERELVRSRGDEAQIGRCVLPSAFGGGTRDVGTSFRRFAGCSREARGRRFD
jgi:1,4-alpha-glucan branching enzyme